MAPAAFAADGVTEVVDTTPINSAGALKAAIANGGTTEISGGEIVSDDTYNKAGDDAAYAVLVTDGADVTLANVQVTGLVVCDAGHEWQARINSRAMGNGCPVCAGKVNQAKKRMKRLTTSSISTTMSVSS